MSEKLLLDLCFEFESLTGLSLDLSSEFTQEAKALVAHLSSQELLSLATRKRLFLAHVNRKFRINKDGLQNFYATAAKHRFVFNYHQKMEIQQAFDEQSVELLDNVLQRSIGSHDVRESLRRKFDPVPADKTLQVLSSECTDPSKLRKPKGSRNIAREILEAQFASFLFVSLPPQQMHELFDNDFTSDNYRDRFWDELHTRHPELFCRNNALQVLRIGQNALCDVSSYEEFRNRLCSWTAELYEKTDNYGFLAIVVESVSFEGRERTWELVGDLILFAEKHRENPLDKKYFRHQKIKEETLNYIPHLDPESASFDCANEGWSYKDCFVFSGSSATASSPSKLLMIFQKNQRDETKIPCPTCRSHNVQGNSYPSLGVRSWECRNRLCPERTKYNRGKRYSFKALVMQQAINDEDNEIPVASVRRWARDVQPDTDLNDINEMLIRHYSLYGDTVKLWNFEEQRTLLETFGREIVYEDSLPISEYIEAEFFKSAKWFHRYIIDRPAFPIANPTIFGDNSFTVYCGDAYEVLKSCIEPNSFDGAITSPPYYNAREYAQWSNIYTYLYDMYNIGRAVFQSLKPGACYLFNIFDYFDNEKSIVFSAMGQRRMILSSYIIDAFRRVGFELLGNVVWDKGEIEGKRGFNAGNFSPYYQSPFNCWEHVLVFRKPAKNEEAVDYAQLLPSVLCAKPVIKMVRGQNIHGHTAPFPEELPRLLTGLLEQGSKILDPFGGSLTTGRVAERTGMASVQIERNEEYCRLGMEMRKEKKERKETAGMQHEFPFL